MCNFIDKNTNRLMHKFSTNDYGGVHINGGTNEKSITINRTFGIDNYGSFEAFNDRTSINRKSSSTNLTQVNLLDGKINFATNNIIRASIENIGAYFGDLYTNNVKVTSDRDKKCNIESVELNALDKIKDMKFYSYNLKAQESDDVIRMASITGYEGTEEIAKNDGITNQPTNFTYLKPLTVAGTKVDIGVMYDEAPTEIQSGDDDNKSIGLYEYISLTAKSVQELSKIVESLQIELMELKKA